MPTRTHLAPLIQRYAEQHPASLARALETMEEHAVVDVLKGLSPTVAAHLMPHLELSHAAALLQDAPGDLANALIQRMQPEQATAILMALAPDVRQTFLDRLPEEIKRQLRELLVYPKDSAGQMMTTEFLALHADVKVRDAIQRIRALATRKAPTTYTYVVDEGRRLVGILTMRDLLIASSDATLASLAKTDVVTIDGFMDREDVVQVLRQRHLFAVPVIDAERRLLGVVKVDRVIQDVQEETTEDLLKMVGAGGDERTTSSMGFALRKRLPWLHVNLATAFLAAGVVALFEDTIAKITILAVFLPVVAGQGGNAGAQSLAVVMRGLALREIRPAAGLPLIWKEGCLGVLNGLIIGVVTALISWWWHGNPFLGVVIGLGMLVNLTAAGIAGAAIPLTMKRLGFDPAQSSSIILTTVTDVIGFFAFLGFAVIFQHHLV